MKKAADVHTASGLRRRESGDREKAASDGSLGIREARFEEESGNVLCEKRVSDGGCIPARLQEAAGGVTRITQLLTQRRGNGVREASVGKGERRGAREAHSG